MIKNKLVNDFKNFSSLLKENNISSADMEKINKAWEFAKEAHGDQKRLSGGPYVAHPLIVANTLVEWKLDAPTIIAALLHDTIEDTATTKEDIQKSFGEEVALLVDGVTKVTSLKLSKTKTDEKEGLEKIYVENLRKMILVMSKDLRVVLLKLADRLHNMQTLSALPKNRQRQNAIETLEIYAPLAERLGIGEVKGELEDLSFPYVYPKEYKRVMNESLKHYKSAESHIMKMKKVLLSKFVKEGLKAQVHGRKKHIYSLYCKLRRPDRDWDFGKINDIVALRIIVDKIPDCYSALGIIHSVYKPVPHVGVSDFIAQPKPNGYRSIHTKVFGPKGRIVEVQIRTLEMHREAEFGITAHWAYSETKTKRKGLLVLRGKGVKIKSTKLDWVKQLVKWQNEITDSKEFIKAVKFDAFHHRNFVFTPLGDVYDLPRGATPIDFAYAVHTGLGKYASAALVDGKIVPLDYKLKSGEVVEIVKSKGAKGPSHRWLEFVITRTARQEINRYLRNKRKSE